MRLYTLHELDRSDGTVQLHRASDNNGDDAVNLVPRPSETDPNDPLRWPPRNKHVAFGSVCGFTFLTNYGIGGLTPAFYMLSLEFDKTMAQASELLIWPILVLGVFNFFWVPLANYLGKRPVFIVGSLLLTACYVWGAAAQTFESLLWSNIVAAFAGSLTEALGASMVGDLYFLHERGAKMGIYMNSISGGNTVGPMVCGFIVTGASWRWHKWIAAILAGINSFTVLLFVPETRYHRDHRDHRDHDGNVAGKPAPRPAVSPGQGQQQLLLLPRKTYAQQLSPWSGLAPNTSLFRISVRPLSMMVYPSVVYAFLGYAVSLVLTVAVNILNPFVLQAPPYGWSPMVNGLINIAGVIGNVAGAYAGGRLVDRHSAWRARRNKGVFEPESRLWLLVLPTLVTGAGCLVFGYGVERTLHWTSLFFGYGMVSFALTAVPTITMAYVSDCLLPVNADALMLVNGLKNIVAFGFLYAIVPWVEEAGYINCFGAQAGVFVAVVAVGAGLLIMFGARARHAQAHWRILL